MSERSIRGLRHQDRLDRVAKRRLDFRPTIRLARHQQGYVNTDDCHPTSTLDQIEFVEPDRALETHPVIHGEQENAAVEAVAGHIGRKLIHVTWTEAKGRRRLR